MHVYAVESNTFIVKRIFTLRTSTYVDVHNEKAPVVVGYNVYQLLSFNTRHFELKQSRYSRDNNAQ